MSEFQLTTPVAFIIFNRPDTTERVFAEIARARPPKLLIVGDGPRTSREGEAAKVAATRAIINRVDWPCEVLTNFSEVNLGCKVRVSSGLDWVFEQVPEAIILEDDCLPHPTFFRFCQELLERYRNDDRFALVCGTSLSKSQPTTDGYYFSRYPHIWGWASWRRVWKKYDVQMTELDSLIANTNFKESFQNKNEYMHWVKCFLSTRDGKIDTWDAQVLYMTFTHALLSIYPAANLISNIGFGEDATHTTSNNSSVANLKTYSFNIPTIHPKFIFPNHQAELDRKIIELIGINYFKKFVHRILQKLRVA